LYFSIRSLGLDFQYQRLQYVPSKYLQALHVVLGTRQRHVPDIRVSIKEPIDLSQSFSVISSKGLTFDKETSSLETFALRASTLEAISPSFSASSVACLSRAWVLVLQQHSV